MKIPDTPVNEASRLESLQSLNIMDTLPEERFERLTRMAKRMFNVPIALVSLVDENRQWFKSCIGLSVRETSRDFSFCGHAILNAEVFIIPDTTIDQRFIDNPLVVNYPNVRFYAGCPLQVSGHKLGTLCIIDTVPREFDAQDIEALRDLASMVEHELTAIQWATLDELTDISNRRGFMMLAQHSLNLCIRQQIPAVLVFIDLDKFKPINDTFGHAEGDAVLIAFANLMKETFRNSDTFARLGGDEFVVLLSSTSQEQAQKAIGKLSTSLKDYNKEIDRGYDVSFSHGIVEFNPQKHTTVDLLLCDGDALMYELKKSKN
ncbi:MAG: sensor domain-containing diguanylate cyclase [Oceanospirillaceae bacterium]